MLAASVALTGCTTLRSPRTPQPGDAPVVYPVSAVRAVDALAEAFRGMRDVAEVTTSDLPAVAFRYQGFEARVTLACLGNSRQVGWWPAVEMSGTRPLIAPWRIAAVLAFYSRLARTAAEVLSATAEPQRIRGAGPVARGACPP